MADNVSVNSTGSSAIATDEVGGAHYQKVKIALGAENAVDNVVDAGQQAMAASVPVALASDQTDVKVTLDGEAVVLGAGSAAIGKLAANTGVDIGDVDVLSSALPTGASTSAKQDTLQTAVDAVFAADASSATSLAIMDDWDEANRAAVNAIAGQVGVEGGSGAVSALTQRVVLATDIALPAGTNNIGDVDILSIAAGDNNIGNVDVVSLPAIPAGTNNIGDVDVLTLPALPAGTNNIGDVDVLTIAAGDNNIGNVDVVSLPALVAGTAAIGKLAANDGVDIGDVTVNNAAGASAVNVQDGGNSLTMDYATTGSGNATGALRVELPTNGTGVIATVGAVTAITNALPAGTNAIGKLAANDGVDIGNVDVASVTLTSAAASLGKAEDLASAPGDLLVAVAQLRLDTPVANANVGTDADYTQLIGDNKGKLWTADCQTEDLGHSTGDRGSFVLGVRNDANASFSGSDLDYTPLAVTEQGYLMNVGNIAHDGADSGSPLKIGAKAANAIPAAVANADRANLIADLFGRLLTSHIDPAMQVQKSANYTSTQTGAVIWDPTSSKKIAITHIVVGAYGTTGARVILWFGDNADATYSAGTDQLVLAASFAPSATSKPGMVLQPATPIFCTTADRELHITTDAGISLDVSVYGYEWA